MGSVVPRTRYRGRFDLEWVIRGEVFRDVAFNALYNQGEQDILLSHFRGGTRPTTFRVGLLKTTYVVNEEDTMAELAIGELAAGDNGGYNGRRAVSPDAVGWPVAEFDSGDYRLSSLQLSWTATGAWLDTAGFIFLMADGSATVGDATGRVVAVAPLDPTRQLQANNDILRIRYHLKLA